MPNVERNGERRSAIWRTKGVMTRGDVKTRLRTFCPMAPHRGHGGTVRNQHPAHI